MFAGQAIHTILRRHPARKVVTIDGLAASIASVIAMAGDEVVMPSNSLMMIHNPEGLAMGGSEDMRKMADTLDKDTGWCSRYLSGQDEATIGAHRRYAEC